MDQGLDAHGSLTESGITRKKSTAEPANASATYRFDFGKYHEEEWNKEPSNYRGWIVKEGIWKNRAYLKYALIQAGMVDGNKDTH